MNNLIRAIPRIIAAVVVALLVAKARCQVLYENDVSPVGNFNNGNGELGNQVSFPGAFGSYLITQFAFQFDFTTLAPPLNIQTLSPDLLQISWPALTSRGLLYSSADLTPGASWSLVTARAPESNGSFYVTVPTTNATQFYRVATYPFGNEMGDFRLYKNDGPPVPPSGAPSPGTLIWDSGTFLLGAYTENSVATFYRSNLNNGIVVPQNFAWTVTFSGLSSDETAGLAIYQTAKVGTNYGAAWIDDDGTNWQFLTGGAGIPSPNFGGIAWGAPLPELQFSAQDGALALSWPAGAGPYFLEMTTNLASPIQWVPLTNAVVINGQNTVTNTISGGSAFYRLVNDSLLAQYPD
jgi:hypothetical protein